MKKLLIICIILFASSSIYGQQIISQWTFNGTTQPVIGQGEASLIGGTITHDLDNRWRMVGFPDQFEDSGTAGASFMVSTEGYENILLTYGHRSSGTQSRWAEVHYTIDGGASWEVLGNNNGGLSPHDVIYDFSFDLSHIPGANNNSGFGIRIVSIFSPVPFNPEEPDEDFDADTAYHRARTEGTGGNPYTGGPDGGNWRLHNVTIVGEPLEDDGDDLDLLHFMVFDTTMANDTPFEMLIFTHSIIHNAFIHYHSALEGYPFDEDHANWRKASMERRNAPTPINYHPEGNNGVPYEESNMRGLQIRQPFTGDGGENTMIFHMPTLLHEDVLFAFAAKDEGAADALVVDYSVSQGDPLWITDGLEHTVLPLASNYQLFAIDFKNISEVNNNSDFHVRIRFDGDQMGADDGDRVTFNNFSLHGRLMDDVSVDEVYKDRQIKLYPNPATDYVFLELPEANTDIRIYQVNGALVHKGIVDGKTFHLDVSGFSTGMYVIQGICPSGNVVTGRLLVKP